MYSLAILSGNVYQQLYHYVLAPQRIVPMTTLLLIQGALRVEVHARLVAYY